MGSAVAEVVSECTDPALRVPVKRLGIPNCFFVQGEAEEVYAYYGFDANGIIDKVREMMGMEFEADESWEDE